MKKDEYILRMLTKVSHKRREYFVVSRVIHLLNDFDVEFTTQQLVRRPNGKRALTDMYFPQFGIHLEIDEAYHNSADQVLKDKRRSEEIISVSEHQIRRIDASASLKEIARQTDMFVHEILAERDKLKFENLFVPWNYEMQFNPEAYRGVGKISVKDRVMFRRQADALRLFGYTKGNYQRGVWKLKGRGGDFVWFPRLYKQKNWDNELSVCGTKIIERTCSVKTDNNQERSPQYYKENINRIVFARATDALGGVFYRYVGTFRFCSKSSKSGEAHFELQRSEEDICLPPEGSYPN